MSKLLIQDDILPGLDVYVEYTFDMRDDLNEVILYDYGLELTNQTLIFGQDPRKSTMHMSLRGFMETRWMPEKLEELIRQEHGL